MSFRLSAPMAAALAGPGVRGLATTWRFEVRSKTRWHRLVEAKRRFVFLLWHEMLLPLLWLHRGQGIAIMVSEARDGQYLAEFAARLGYRRLLGSSSRGGARVLLQAVRALEDGIPVAITPDGPRGPRREIKPGILHAAQRAGADVLPIVAVADRKWQLSSWDRFVIPKPFARVRIGYGQPFTVGPDEPGFANAQRRAYDELETLEQELAWPPATVTATD